MNYYNTDPDSIFNKTDVATCKQLFEVNLWCNLVVVISVSIIAVFQIVKVVFLSKKYFLSKHVVHSARSWDENIIVHGS